jgi:formate-dependent nitrite reductase membrane component NrfD
MNPVELTITRHNELIDPFVHVWGWEIPVYLFLGGWVAGMMILSGYFLVRRRHQQSDCVCFLLPGLSLVLLSLGMLALFLDLEHKPYTWRLYTTFEVTSPMSWGAWILLLVYPALVANMILRVPPPLARRLPALAARSEQLRGHAGFVRGVGVLNMVLGVMLGTYTGVLLSSLGARPLWNSPVLGLLFLASGLSTAAAFVHLVASNREERELLVRFDNAFLTAELFIIGSFLTWMISASQAQMNAAELLLGGPYTAVFWVGVMLLGIVLPLAYQSFAVSHRVPHSAVFPILVILGGLLLRFVMVDAGQHSHWLAAFLR